MLFTNFARFAFAIVLATFVAVNQANEDASLLYSHTRICSGHSGVHCMSIDKKNSFLRLSRKHRLRFEIETVERINMQLNRIYTETTDKKTGDTTKLCLVRADMPKYGVSGVKLEPCDTSTSELVLAVDTPLTGADIKMDEFALKEVSYLEDGSAMNSELCLTTATVSNGALQVAAAPFHLQHRNVIILSDCAEETAFAQDFKARGFDSSHSARVVVSTEAPEIEAKIGRFCLVDKPDLCLGVSLENGVTLANDVFVQVKNYTKNEAKNLHDLKMRWYHDLKNGRIASAANLNYCLEAVYGASIGRSRRGEERYDDIVHLGSCDGALRTDSEEDMESLPSSEQFYTEASGSFVEVRTDVPSDASVEGDQTKCISIVRCVRHDFGHCTKYNSVEVFDPADLEQGAYARLKDCNSEDMASQRFSYIEEDEITFPPTNYPTPKPQTVSPTSYPTTVEDEETTSPTTSPTPLPTESDVEPVATNAPTKQDGSTTDDVAPGSTPQTGLLAGLAFVGLLCIAVIIAGVAYYYKQQSAMAGTPEEDENFIARV